jgi:hypothetical protein
VFAGYEVAPILDGIVERGKLDWSKAAWASAESDETHSLEIRLPQPRRGGMLKINWQDGHASRAFVVQTFSSTAATATSESGGAWRDVKRFAENRDAGCEVALPNEAYDAVRVIQSAGGGSALRPNLMWISQVRLLP